MGPANEQEAACFQALALSMKKASSAVGWVISLGKYLEEGHQFYDGLLEKVNLKLPGVDSRLCTAYTTLLYCTKKVSQQIAN